MRVVNRHEITDPEHRHAYKPHEGASRLDHAFKHGEWIKGLERTNMLCRSRHEVLEQVRRGEWIVVDELAYSFYPRPPSQEELEQKALQEQIKQHSAPTAPRPVSPSKPKDCVFAKSGLCRPGSSDAGVSKEPADNFGQLAVLGTIGTVAAGDTAMLGRITGQLPHQKLGMWGLRSLATATAGANALLLAFWPRDIADGTLYTEEQLRDLSEASTRVRFQFRTDEQGVRHVYGLHTSSESGLANVPTVHVQWGENRRNLEAKINDGLTIYWSPNNGPISTAPSPYPAFTDGASNILVHPIAPDTDSQIEIYPAEGDRTLQDYILVFPQDAGVSPLYIALSAGDHNYHLAPDIQDITGFLGLRHSKPKTPKQGGGGLRERWIDSKARRIYEWDSQHGELEVYRASDGSHIGAFDYVTGEQLKPANKKRNIKKFL